MSKKNISVSVLAASNKLGKDNNSGESVSTFDQKKVIFNKEKVKTQMKEMLSQSTETKVENKPRTTIEIHHEKILELGKLNQIAGKCNEQHTLMLKALLEENADTQKLIEYYRKQVEMEKKVYEDLDSEEKRIKYREELLIEQARKEMDVNMHNIQTIKEECYSLEADLTSKEYRLTSLRQKSAEIEHRIEYNNLELEDKIKLKLYKQSELMNKEKLVEETKMRIMDVNRINSDYIDYLRMIHNDLQETKGNIRVFCRVRPPLMKELKEEGSTTNSFIDFPNYNTIILNGPVTKSNTGKRQETQNREIYKFDRVFRPEDTQEDVFKEISQLVQSALDGYKVCIFAYGQTGSGKTYTMEGEENDKRGIIPRSIEQIFEFKSTLEGMGWNFTIEASCFEIYMDQVRDLLMSSTSNILPPNKSDKFTVVEVKQVEDLQQILESATKKRAVAETECNEQSSRSHCIFQLRITGRNAQTKQERFGALNLIDLAGSERVSNSKVEGDRLKETISINKSLTALKSVITALVNTSAKTIHIPYRDSILTFLLQSYLGGDSKTLMFVNISPLLSNFSESSCSLKFASDVNSCYLKSIDDK